jgi:hypothetical protein
MIRRLRRDLSDQRISERYNILLGNLGHRIIRALAEKLQKLRKTAAIKSHCGCSSFRLLAIKPIVQILAEAGPHNSFTRKFPMQSIRNRLCLPDTLQAVSQPTAQRCVNPELEAGQKPVVTDQYEAEGNLIALSSHRVWHRKADAVLQNITGYRKG